MNFLVKTICLKCLLKFKLLQKLKQKLIFQLKEELNACKVELKTCKEKLNKYEPVSFVNEEEIQVNNKAACSSHLHLYNSSNKVQSSYNEVLSTNKNGSQSTSTNDLPSTFSNETPLSVINGDQSTIEFQKCDAVSSNSVVTFDRVVG